MIGDGSGRCCSIVRYKWSGLVEAIKALRGRTLLSLSMRIADRLAMNGV
jgi:hypothetical protein